jgi:tRNA pseudouridine38-40 synthase
MSGDSAVQLVLQYDGSGFAGWQRQSAARTVQGTLEEVLQRLLDGPVRLTGAGRTDAGVHARGQAAALRLPDRWSTSELQRALNSVLPADIFVSAAHAMLDEFHPRYSAVSRTYIYQLGTDAAARSPFRNRYEWQVDRKLSLDTLQWAAGQILGEHSFRAFAVQGTAPAQDNHMCHVLRAEWREVEGGLHFEIEASRFLHHMVRFLVGTMVEAASGKRPAESMAALLLAADNREVSAPAPPHGLFLERVLYPETLYAAAGERC